MRKLGAPREKRTDPEVSEEVETYVDDENTKPLNTLIHTLEEISVLKVHGNTGSAEFIPRTTDTFSLFKILSILLKEEVDWVLLDEYVEYNEVGFLTFGDALSILIKLSSLRSFEDRRMFLRDIQLWEYRAVMWEDKKHYIGGGQQVDFQEYFGLSGTPSKDGTPRSPKKRSHSDGSAYNQKKEDDLGGEVLFVRPGEKRDLELDQLSDISSGDSGDIYEKHYSLLKDSSPPVFVRGFHKNLFGLKPKSSLWQALLIMMNLNVHKLVVKDKGKPTIMVISDYDIVSGIVRYGNLAHPFFKEPIKKFDVGLMYERIDEKGNPILYRQTYCVTHDTPLDKALMYMNCVGRTFLPIIDKKGKVVDVFTKADVANVLQRVLFSFEEEEMSKYNDEEEDEGEIEIHISPNTPNSPRVKFRICGSTVGNMTKNRLDSNRIKCSDTASEKKRRSQKDMICYHQRLENVSSTYQDRMMSKDFERVDLSEIIIHEDSELQYVLRHLVGKNIRHVIQVDRQGKFQRLITMQCIFELLIRYYVEDMRMSHPDEDITRDGILKEEPEEDTQVLEEVGDEDTEEDEGEMQDRY